METNKNPLVTVSVIAYNSSSTIIETLESIYNQTYPRLELIISDDCSKDTTVSICQEWLSTHKDRFERTEIITVHKNTGVSANYNRAFDASKGEWIKEIDGDDILFPNCVATYMDYVDKHANAIYMFAKVKLFGIDKNRLDEIKNWFNYDFYKWNTERQIDYLMFERNCIPSNSAFYKRDAIIKLGIRNDERIPLLEDWPKWINLLRAGVKFEFIDKVTVMYRISDASLSTSRNISPTYRKSVALVYKFYIFPTEYERGGDKKEAIYKYMRAHLIIKDNNILWHILCKMYKLFVLRRL